MLATAVLISIPIIALLIAYDYWHCRGRSEPGDARATWEASRRRDG